MASPRVSKAPSITSSAGTNKSTSLSFLPRYTPKPEPAYVSPAAAADFVLHSHDEDQRDQVSPSASPTNEPAVFSERSLSLLNTFLDSLLYNFLVKARGTSLSQLKPAITEVLKAKLARDALASADEELEGLVGEAGLAGQEGVTTFGGREGWSQEWHLEMAFKRMRLRVMVFIRLGDFDDEDEEKFLDEEDDLRTNEKVEQEDMLASPAAVYLASVLEYIAERALQIAGEAAWKRAAGKAHRRFPSDQSELSDVRGLVIQESDVEKITLNPTLGRLWRTWRKNYRVMSAGTAGAAGLVALAPPSPTYESSRGRLGSLNETIATAMPVEEKTNRHLSADEIPEGDVLESDIAANIPLPINDNDVEEIETIGVPDQDAVAAIALPIGDNDINEIEVPGLAKEITDDEEAQVDPEHSERPRRPISVVLSWLTPFSWAPEKQERPKLQRLRSNSVPTRNRPMFLNEEVFTPSDERPEPAIEPGDEGTISSDMDEGIVGIPDIENISPEGEEGLTAGNELELEPAVGLKHHIASTALDESHNDLSPSNPNENQPTIASEPDAAAASSEKEPMAEPMVKAADILPSSVKEQSANTGYIAGAAAGAATLAGVAAAYTTGASKDGSAGVAPKSQERARDEEKPRSPLSSSIADRRRMFEAQVNGAGTADSATQQQEAPPFSPPVIEDNVSSIAQEPSVRDSSLEGKRTIATTAAAVVPTVAATDEIPRLPTDPAIKKVDPRVDRMVVEGSHVVHDDRAIGVARTSDIPVPYPKTQATASPPAERQRSYHLPGNQSPQAYQGRATHSNRNAGQDTSPTDVDDSLPTREQADSKQTSMRPTTKQEMQQNGSFRLPQNAAQNVTFYHSDEEKEKNEQSLQKTRSSTSKPRPPPLMMASPESTEISNRPVSRPRSASSTPGGHSNKGSSSSSTVQRHLDKKSLEESRQRDFDSLLKNNEPIKYTLTPDDLRTTATTTTTTITRSAALADRAPPSPRIISSPGTYAAKRSPPRENNSVRRETHSPTTSLAAGRKVGIPRVSEYKRAAANRLSSRPEKMNTGAVRSGFMPREPRVVTDDTADLADYMASTAPAQEQTVLPLALSAGATRLDNGRSSSPLRRGSFRQRLVPREPDVKKDGTSDLIDFIRQGPPGSKPEKEQRRTVAPFRTTMDSDDFNGLGDFTSTVDKSFGSSKRDSSFNSGLLGNSSSNRGGSVLVASGGPQIVKKQRRVKDPYAIDSDDDEDYMTSLSAAGRAVQQPKEESLADFLRHSEPPAGSNEPTALGVGSAKAGPLMGRSGSHTIAAAGKAPNAKSSMINAGFSFPTISKMKVEARAAGATRNGFGGNGFYYSTNDMADFLKSSGPVETTAPTQQPQLQKKPSKRSVGSKRSIGSRSFGWLRGDR